MFAKPLTARRFLLTNAAWESHRTPPLREMTPPQALAPCPVPPLLARLPKAPREMTLEIRWRTRHAPRAFVAHLRSPRASRRPAPQVSEGSAMKRRRPRAGGWCPRLPHRPRLRSRRHPRSRNRRWSVNTSFSHRRNGSKKLPSCGGTGKRSRRMKCWWNSRNGFPPILCRQRFGEQDE